MAQNKKARRTPAYSTDTMVVCLIVGLMLIALGVLIFLANALNMAGDVFDALRQFSRGMCGALAIALPVLPIWGGVLVIMSIQRKPPMRPFLLICLMMLLCSTAATLVTFVGSDSLMDYLRAYIAGMGAAPTMSAFLARSFDFGSHYAIGGGLIGMLLAWPLWTGLGAIGGAILTIIAAVADFLFLIRLDVKGLWHKGQDRKAQRRAQQEAQAAQQHQQELAWQQEQMRLRQEHARMQEEMRQQQIRQQLQQSPQPVYQQPYQQNFQQNPYDQGPIVRQVQPRNQAPQPAQNYGFPPSPEELDQGSYDFPPAGQEPPRKKKGGIFNREKQKEGEAVATSRRRVASEQPTEPIPVQPARPARPAKTRQAPQAPLFTEEEPPRRRAPLRREEQEPAPALFQEEPVFTPEPPAAPAPQPAARPVAARPVAAARTPAPPEAVDENFAAETKEKPISENSFLSRLRAAKKAAGLEVPDEPAAPAKTEEDWANTPPWEEAAPAKPAAPLKPVVTQQKPEGGYEPDLNLKPRRAGRDQPAAPIIEEAPEIPYVFPAMDLLAAPSAQTGFNPEEDALRSRRLENTLQSFRIPAKVRNITHGPTISRFELELAPGIKVSKVTDLNRNIAMNMEVPSVRIEAPIPGKSLVGVEISNKVATPVTLREVLESDAMRKAAAPLTVALGKDIGGAPIVCDLAKMPHLLIAGTTGSGKSVWINTIINSLLYRRSPKEVKLLLVDPKRVELQCYNGLPHLLIPVVSDPRKASHALAWAVGEMMDRYNQLHEAGARNIDTYNEHVGPDGEKMPHIVIIIDELADLMLTCKKDVEERICRIAQLARAAGIHLIVATQRPSTDIITGLIKANIPSRIAFTVSSNVDSRTIIDRIGAEQLQGKGDMLYMPIGAFSPIRVQGCFLSEAEVNRVTDFIRETCPAEYDAAVLAELERLQAESNQEESGLPDMPSPDECISGDGSLLSQCIEMAVNDGQVSTSLIQRRLRLGYARAGRLVDEMERKGIVGPKDGAKPRMCLISREEFEAMKASGELE